MPAHPDFLRAFSAGIANGAPPPGLTATAPEEAIRRFAVYRNNVTVSLIDAVGKRFPVIARLVGEDFFKAMARLYAEQHRPKSPIMMIWGDTFPDFLAAFPPLADYPYMADVARIELARGRAYHSADAVLLSAEGAADAAASPENARLWLHPSVQMLQLAHPAVSIWQVNQPGAEARPIPPGPECALILRDPQFNVPVMLLGPGDAAFVGAILSGERLLTAAELAQFADPLHDPQSILISLMQAGAFISPPEVIP